MLTIITITDTERETKQARHRMPAAACSVFWDRGQLDRHVSSSIGVAVFLITIRGRNDGTVHAPYGPAKFTC